MATNDLQVAPRSVLGKEVAKLRRAGQTPANVYGHKIDSKAIQADTAALLRLFKGASRNQIINLKVDDEDAPRTVVVRDVARDPVTHKVLHVDFFQVSMTEKMRAQVQVVLTGTSDAVETYQGILLQMLESIEVEALVTVHTDPDVVVARVAAPRLAAEEEEAAAPVEGEAAEGEEGAPAEGAPAPAEESSE
jgi:large subunit ribosomal protein L25